MLPITLLWDSWPNVWQWLAHRFQRRTFPYDASDLLESQFYLHALRNPLTNLTMNLELSLTTLNTHPTLTRNYLTQALDSMKHLHNLVYLLQNQTQPKLGTFKVQPALQEVSLQYHQPHRQRFLTCTLHLDPHLTIKGNLFYFQEALACLINNAFEAYPQRRASKHVWVTAYSRPKQLIIYIGDVAEGMPWFHQHLAFLKGFSSKKQGSGLGLTFTKRIVEKHLHGSLSVASFAGTGSVFVITIPLKT